MPEEGCINEKGLEFYGNLVDELLAAGIMPMCTLFHWNLPMWIHEQGGWLCDKVSDYFAEYVKNCGGSPVGQNIRLDDIKRGIYFPGSRLYGWCPCSL